jgi:hypothetical protein
MKIVRRLRLIEYIGTEDFVNRQIENRQLKGTKVLGDGSIREALLGDTNEILLDAEIEQIINSRKAENL